MKRLEALEYYKDSFRIDTDILCSYKDADTHFYVNDNDPDLTPQRINLPEPPIWHLIDGFGLPCSEQYWRIPPTPEKILALVDKHTFADDVWSELQNRQKYYKEEILWIKRQWHYRLYGYWFFNNGKPTFLDGWHYWYLAVYNLDVGAAEYRDRDRRWFLFAKDCATTTKAPLYAEWDEKGRPTKVAVDENGDVKLKDYGRLLCYGFCYPKHRRDGATHKSISVGLEIGTRSVAALIGLQSYTSANAHTQFTDKLVPAFQKIPFFFKPIVDSSTNPKENISCNAPAERNKDGRVILYKKKELKTKFDYAQTADKSYYNGKKLKYILLDEEGNTSASSQEDIFDRWNVVKECQSIGDEIVGFSIHPTTVEEANATTISNFRRLCEQSRFEQINELTGQTASGLRTLFIPAYDGMKGFIDKHGLSVITNPTPEQAAFIKKKYGAKDFINSQREILLKKGTPTAMRQYHRFVELFPTTYAECFQGASTSIGFNTVKINDRLSELYRLTGKDKPLRGDFEFEGGDQTGKVVFKENPEGRFLISHLPPEEIRSKRVLQNGVYYPAFPGKYVAGGDPFEFSTKTEAQLRESRERMSDGGGAVIRLRDMNIDPDNKDVSEWETYNIVCTYRYRPAGNDYSWDMIKMCVYFGAMMYLENNIKTLWRDFIEFGFGGYLLHDIDPVTGKIVEKPGFWAGAAANQDRFNSVRDYIEYHSTRIKHDDFLEECKRMRGIEYLKDCDLVSAVSAALLGAKSAYNRYMQQMTVPNDNGYGFSSFYKRK